VPPENQETALNTILRRLDDLEFAMAQSAQSRTQKNMEILQGNLGNIVKAVNPLRKSCSEHSSKLDKLALANKALDTRLQQLEQQAHGDAGSVSDSAGSNEESG
jgi:uncharacterized protein YoxC